MVHVVRDDLLPGGAKERGLGPFLEEEIGRGAREFVYASPFCAWEQVTLAAACRRLRVPCRLFCEADPSAGTTLAPHDVTERANLLGAQVSLHASLREAEADAARYERTRAGAKRLPLGFDTDGFRHTMGRAVERAWREVEIECGAPKHLWLPFGSGTLLGVFRAVLPEDVTVHAVNVRVLDDSDPRVIRAKSDPRVVFHRTGLRVHERATTRAPVPSNAFHDAKLWDFVLREGRAGDVWWNVAR